MRSAGTARAVPAPELLYTEDAKARGAGAEPEPPVPGRGGRGARGTELRPRGGAPVPRRDRSRSVRGHRRVPGAAGSRGEVSCLSWRVNEPF